MSEIKYILRQLHARGVKHITDSHAHVRTYTRIVHDVISCEPQLM